MKGCPLYNGQNLVFTGPAYSKPYGIIQNGGLRRKTRKTSKTRKTRTNKRRTNKISRKRRNTHTKKRYNR
jgi:hypothetical protein